VQRGLEFQTALSTTLSVCLVKKFDSFSVHMRCDPFFNISCDVQVLSKYSRACRDRGCQSPKPCTHVERA